MQLTVYLTNACNMACRYCAVTVNQGPKSTLDWGTLKKGLDYFLTAVPDADEVTFSGGEPLIRFDLLKSALSHLNSQRRKPQVTVYTNGTLLTAESLKVLSDFGARVIISVDGNAQANDRDRIFSGSSKASVHHVLFDRLQRLPTDFLEVLITVTPQNVGTLLSGMRFLHRRRYRKIHFIPEFFRPWSDTDLTTLDRQLVGLKHWYLRLARDQDTFESEPISEAVRRNRENSRGNSGEWWKQCDTLVLGDDGNFYSCHSSQMSPKAKGAKLRIGNTDTGIRWKKRERAISRAGAFLESLDVDYPNHLHCPMLFYHSGPVLGRDARDLVHQADRVAQVFSRRLAELANAITPAPAASPKPS